jgi:hypothetical protein
MIFALNVTMVACWTQFGALSRHTIDGPPDPLGDRRYQRAAVSSQMEV